MTKWNRLRKLREKKRFEAEVLRPKAEGEEVKQTEPEKISKNFQQSQEIEKLDNTKNSKLTTILAQIPRYAYLLAIFALLAGIFFPLITPQIPTLDYVISGIAVLFLGLAGGILLFKATTSDNRRGILIVTGFVLTTTSLLLVYHIHNTFGSLFT
jgi:hypothetical protein